MPTDRENVCCGNRECTSSNEYFRATVLDPDVLQVQIRYHADFLNIRPDYRPASFRKAAYRMYVLGKYGYLGAGNREVAPSCAARCIRHWYPSPTGDYMGYRSSWGSHFCCSVASVLAFCDTKGCRLLVGFSFCFSFMYHLQCECADLIVLMVSCMHYGLVLCMDTELLCREWWSLIELAFSVETQYYTHKYSITELTLGPQPPPPTPNLHQLTRDPLLLWFVHCSAVPSKERGMPLNSLLTGAHTNTHTHMVCYFTCSTVLLVC